MKSILYSFIAALSLLIIQCSNEIPTTNDPINLELGKVSLKIDKANAPAEVVLVEAFLTREGHDTLYGNLNLISSTSADILFEDVAAGQWHLKVDAKDSSGVVLYTGETDINILAGILTQVNLTLVPTGHGTGSIYIFVHWGVSNTWIDFSGNPILVSQNSIYDYYGVSQSAVIKDSNLYKMWYLGDAGSARGYVLYAESFDGINWNFPYSEPVLSPGLPGSWDSWTVHPGAVIKDGGIYKMFYTGWSDTYGHWHVGLATSTDGINWIKYPNPVLSGNNNEYQVGATSVIKINDTYYMYYTGGVYQQVWWISLATSTDGINWTKYSGNPILTSNYSWEGYGVYHPSVIEENGAYKMVYMSTNSNGFGFAISEDGINWTTLNSNPFFTIENTSNHWSSYIAYPNMIKVDENEIRIYYSGIPNNSAYFSVGFMKKIQ
jgi:predicted GH43/DUF377 family glycosyl hydrolase